MATFGPKPWLNPFGKMSIFRLLELFVCIAYQGAFSFQIIVKVIFLTNTALQKRLEKWPYLEQNHGLTPLEKCQFFDILNLLFLQPRKAFFVLQYRKSHIPNQYCLKKMLEKWPYWDQNHDLTPLEKCQFSDFWNFLFLLARKAFSQSRISKKLFS